MGSLECLSELGFSALVPKEENPNKLGILLFVR